MLPDTYPHQSAKKLTHTTQDDYHFLPFIFGSSQNRKDPCNPHPTPYDVLAQPAESRLKEGEDFFQDAILDILRCKRGPFSEHSPLLHSLAACPSWEELNSGLIRMWKVEVLGKFPVAQHFWFGKSLPVTWAMTETTPQMAAAVPSNPYLVASTAIGLSGLGGEGINPNDPLAKYFKMSKTTELLRSSAGVSAPLFTPSERSISYTLREDGSGIDLVGDGWKIYGVFNASISGEEDVEQMRRDFPNELDYPLPEMLFSKNFLRLEREGQVVFKFDAKEALRGCKLIGGVPPDRKMIKVPMADKWDKRVDGKGQQIKTWREDYDWTFTTKRLCKVETTKKPPSRTPRRIDYEKLKQREPIIWSKEVILFEDDLFDLGISKYSVKIRVMPSCFFALSRFFLRVDDTFVRCIDVRVFHVFGSKYVLIETSQRESEVNALKNVQAKDLHDPNLAATLLPLIGEPITEEVAL